MFDNNTRLALHMSSIFSHKEVTQGQSREASIGELGPIWGGGHRRRQGGWWWREVAKMEPGQHGGPNGGGGATGAGGGEVVWWPTVGVMTG